MPIQVNFNGLSLLKPGAYSRAQIALNPGNPVSSSGVVGIVGEAAGGAPGSVEGVQTYSINQIFDITQKYVSGQIVDAVRLLAQPGKDTDIPAGASVVKIWKTNNSTQASSTVKNQDSSSAATILNATSANYGLPENQVNFYTTEGTQGDSQANITSGVITFPLTLTATQTMILTIAGVAYTYTVSSNGPYANVAALIAEVNNAANWAPSKPVVVSDATDGSGSKIKLTLDTTAAAFLGYATRHEYVIMYVSGGNGAESDLKFRSSIAFATDGTAGGTFTANSITGLSVGSRATIIDNNSPALVTRVTGISGSGPYTITLDYGNTNIAAYTQAQSAKIFTQFSSWSDADLKVSPQSGGFVRGARGSRIFVIKKNDQVETISENTNAVLVRIWYKGAGSAATLKVRDVAGVRRLQTTCTGAGSDNLDLDLTQFGSIRQLVDYITNFNSGAAYICTTDYFNAAVTAPTQLDYLDTIDIKLMPLELKGAIVEIVSNVNTYSQYMRLATVSNVYGQIELISSSARKFLTGGTRGISSNTSFQNGFDAMLTTRVNTVIPLISRDASAEAAVGATDVSSTYTVAAVVAQADAHVRLASNTQNRSERNAYAGFKGTLAASYTLAQTTNSEYLSLAIQDVKALNASGNAVWYDPWMFAVIAAGMQAGSPVGTPLTHKYMNAVGIRHSEFDPRTQYNTAISNGLLFAEQPDDGGVRIVVGNTTYLRDDNPVFNRISVFEIVNYVAYDSRIQLENAFIGKTRASGTSLAVAIKTFFQGILNGYTRAQILTPDAANKGLGYRDVVVLVTGGIVRLSATITPAPGIDFILEDLTIAQVNDAA